MVGNKAIKRKSLEAANETSNKSRKSISGTIPPIKKIKKAKTVPGQPKSDDDERKDDSESELKIEDEEDYSDDSSENEINGDNKKNTKQVDGTSEFIVFVGHLNFQATENDLKQHFHQAGEVVNVNLVKHGGNRSRGFGFVQLKNKTAYKKALQLNHTTLKDREIIVQATERKSLEVTHDNPGKPKGKNPKSVGHKQQQANPLKKLKTA